MSSNHTQINCPKCNTLIDVQDVLSKQVESEINKKYKTYFSAEKEKLEEEKKALLQKHQNLENQKKQADEEFNRKLQDSLKQERSTIEQALRKSLQEEQSTQLQELQNELQQKSEQVKELNRTKAEIEKLKREKDELKEAVELESQQKLTEMLAAEREKIRRSEEDKNELKFKELQKQLEDQKRLTEEMKRKQEQGSMQMQGEVQELAIEEWLTAKFPYDTIEEIKKGARGGDCIQIVNTPAYQNCGKIYYESKRTKDFQPSWIDKFKGDMRDKSADVGILVTEAKPNGMDRMGLYDGIWVCSFDEFKSLCFVIRELVIKVNNAQMTQENKGDKMSILYDFLTSNTFRMQVEAIVEGFSSLKQALESEKRAMQRIWKEREKQIEKVTSNTIDMYGSIKGIAGSAIQSVQSLELPFSDEEDEIELLED